MTMFSTKYPNNIRTVSGLNVPVFNTDVVLQVDTSLGACSINLEQIPDDFWSTQWKLYIYDISNNASVNNITINAGSGQKINNATTLVLSANGAGVVVSILSNSTFIGSLTNAASAGITSLTVTDTATIDLNLTPITGGFNLQANLILADYMFAVKNLTDTNTLFCRTTKSIGPAFQKYENPFQSIADGSIFTAYDTKSEFGALVGSFDLATGTFTAPSAGLYYIQTQIGWALNSNSYSNLSTNPNTLGQYWMLNYVELYRVIDILTDPILLVTPPSIGDRYIVGTPAAGAFAGQGNNIAQWNGLTWVFTVPLSTTITQNFIFVINTSATLTWNGTAWIAFIENLVATGSLSIAQYLVGSGLMSVGLKTINMSSTQLYITTVSTFRLGAFSPVRVVYTNNTDLPMYGQTNSNVILRIQKISN